MDLCRIFLIFSNPVLLFQNDEEIPYLECSPTVSKKSLYKLWNCGDTSLVFKFKTRLTFLTCCGDDPRFMPSLALGDHFAIFLPY